MGAVPKSRISQRRKHQRRSHYRLPPVPLVVCEKCKEYHRPHHVCPNCGTLRGVEIIAVTEGEG